MNRTSTNRGGQTRAYRPIADYGLIGDTHTAALVATDGAIDWCCCPRFDSPAVFCRLLDSDRGGWFRIGPAGEFSVERGYVGDTNVLRTSFTTDSGRVTLTDFMPAQSRTPGPELDPRDEDVVPSHRVLRLVECTSGEVDLEVRFRPTFGFASAKTVTTSVSGGALAVGEDESITLTSPVPLRIDPTGAAGADLRVRAGERLWFIMTYRGEASVGANAFAPGDPEAELARTLEYWRRWSEHCTYEGPYHALVRRSALVLKLLTYEPTGAVVAAPTTSLPEEVGGIRNWDYRYTWLRDAALLLYSLQSIGYHDEADDFFRWLEKLCIECGDDLQVVYRIDGTADLSERVLNHLDGYRSSRPVRIGNAAAAQRQLDAYGSLLDAAHLHAFATDEPPRPEFWEVLRYLANQAAARWTEPGHGIWEIRGPPRHFLYSKLICWVAVDRAVSLAECWRLPGEVERWRQARCAIREAILETGYNPDVGAFTQVLGGAALDAGALTIPHLGFLPATDPRVRSTLRVIRDRLTSSGLVYRYLDDDGLPGHEGTFALCSFWLADTLALSGEIDEARAVFERIAGCTNDLGLLAEEIDPASGELLGNFPQGFSHLALIRTALHIARAEVAGPKERATTPVE